MATDAQRAVTLAGIMRATIADARRWVYDAVRPLPLPATWQPGQPVTSDCSWGCRLIYRWAGQPDPMHAGYGGGGNSATLAMRNPHLGSPAELEPGDGVTVGSYGQIHAALVLESGADPLLWSDGHQGAPNSYRLSYDRRWPKQYLRLPRNAPPPETPQDKLRGRTGWFAWAAWRLGEHPWEKYGKANPNVRPNVPKVIPPEWWIRLARFTRARRRGNKADGPT